MSTAILSGDFNVSMNERVIFRTLVTPFESGKEQRRSKWSKPIRSWGLQYRGRQQSRMQELWNFYTARQGAYDTFYFENINESPISLSGDEVIGVGDGVTTNYTLDRFPIVSNSQTITVGASGYSEGVDYTLNDTTGAISFTTTPPSGDAITATTYRFYYICRFVEDYMDRELFAQSLYNGALKIMQVI